MQTRKTTERQKIVFYSKHTKWIFLQCYLSLFKQKSVRISLHDRQFLRVLFSPVDQYDRQYCIWLLKCIIQDNPICTLSVSSVFEIYPSRSLISDHPGKKWMISYFYSLYRLTEYIKDTHIEHLAMPTLLGLASKYKFTFDHIGVVHLFHVNIIC